MWSGLKLIAQMVLLSVCLMMFFPQILSQKQNSDSVKFQEQSTVNYQQRSLMRRYVLFYCAQPNSLGKHFERINYCRSLNKSKMLFHKIADFIPASYIRKTQKLFSILKMKFD